MLSISLRNVFRIVLESLSSSQTYKTQPTKLHVYVKAISLCVRSMCRAVKEAVCYKEKNRKEVKTNYMSPNSN